MAPCATGEERNAATERKSTDADISNAVDTLDFVHLSHVDCNATFNVRGVGKSRMATAFDGKGALRQSRKQNCHSDGYGVLRPGFVDMLCDRSAFFVSYGVQR
ncbi:hypothetical protein KC358_g25 [Hortaea werneckii]|nr:hypothetical protein KC358_g25 [Hortaea werneckii]